MIRRKSSRRRNIIEPSKQKGFDDFHISLGDIMRGERATLGKSLIDVQDALKIKAIYIAAVEESNPSVFDTPGFIAGYVRSYAKYLGMDPENAFDLFCKESGFTPVHGMSNKSLPNKVNYDEKLPTITVKPFNGLGDSTTPFAPPSESFLNELDFRAMFSSLVLLLLLGVLGYGAKTVVQKIQLVQLVPIEQSPLMLSGLDPLRPRTDLDLTSGQAKNNSDEIYSRLYRPQALNTPVLIPRDSSISSLNPGNQGLFLKKGTWMEKETSIAVGVNNKPETGLVSENKSKLTPRVQILAPMPNRVQLVAKNGVWLRVKDANGSIIYEQVMDAQDPFDVPILDRPALIERAGNSGSLFFLVNGQLYGPAGNGTRTVKNIYLSPENLIQTYDVYSPDRQSSFYSFLRDLEASTTMQ